MLCRASGLASSREVVHAIRNADDPIEAIYNSHKDEDDQSLTNPFRKRPICRLHFAACYGGLVGFGVRSEGAVIRWRPNEQWRGFRASCIVVGRRRIVGRIVVDVVVVKGVVGNRRGRWYAWRGMLPLLATVPIHNASREPFTGCEESMAPQRRLGVDQGSMVVVLGRVPCASPACES